VKQTNDGSHRLLGAYQRALPPASVRPNPPWIWEKGAPAADLLVLRRSTEEALSPSHLQITAASANPTDPPPPPRPARSGEESPTQARKEGRNLITEIVEEEAAARAPTTGAEGDASNLSMLWIG
jgi:hypothetical protein